MGYYLNDDIAKRDTIREPIPFSLACNANFLVFEKIGKQNVGHRMILQLKVKTINDNLNSLEVKFTKDGTVLYTFTGHRKIKSLNSYSFLLNNDPSIMAENLKSCIMNHIYFSSNFDVYITEEKDEINEVSHTINIVPKAFGDEFNLSLNNSEIHDYISVIIKQDKDKAAAYNTPCEINLDIYTGTGLLQGDADVKPGSKLGEYVTTFSKNYNGEALWFDINQVPRNNATYSDDFLRTDGWCDAGTVTDLRIAARRYQQGNNQTFYISDPLFMLKGYARTLEDSDLSDYVYNPKQRDVIKLLTNQPELMIVKGQAQYINFILAKNHLAESDVDTISVVATMYSQSKRPINEEIINEVKISDLSIVNTLRLDTDLLLNKNENVGYMEFFLRHSEKQISYPLCFKVMPEYLAEVRDFAFLNRLGGWSAFSFGAKYENEFKTSPEVMYATLTPEHSLSTSIETVYRKDVSEQFVVQTNPVTREVADWLKEMSASPAIYELDKKAGDKLFRVADPENEVLSEAEREYYKKRIARYIIADELVIKHNTTDELYRVEMKYHYSDSYNAQLNSK